MHRLMSELGGQIYLVELLYSIGTEMKFFLSQSTMRLSDLVQEWMMWLCVCVILLYMCRSDCDVVCICYEVYMFMSVSEGRLLGVRRF